MPRVGFETTIPVFERAKTVHALDCAANVIDTLLKLRCWNNADKLRSKKRKWPASSLHQTADGEFCMGRKPCPIRSPLHTLHSAVSFDWACVVQFIFFPYFSHGVRLSPFGTAATVWPTVPVLDGRWYWLWSNCWNAIWKGKPKYSEKTYHSSTLFTTNPTWSNPGLNPGRYEFPLTPLHALSRKVYCSRRSQEERNLIPDIQTFFPGH
jgi:hypothetical protein